MYKKRILITGSSGFIGFRIVPVLTGQDYDVTVLTRSPEKTAQHFNHTVITVKQLDTINE